MKITINVLALLVFTFFLCQCKTKNLSSEVSSTSDISEKAVYPFLTNTKLILLDSSSASEAIVEDEVDHLFRRVTYTEMAIQMKENRDCQDRNTCVEGYKEFLRKDVESFSEEDKGRIKEVFDEIAIMLDKVNNNLFQNQEIILIKTKANHYGEGVFYTRENKIIIPIDVLSNFNKSRFKETMLHELFHIYSRYNNDTRDQLYSLIGFSPITGKLVLPENLQKRKLLNPDGTTDYMIKVGEKIAYPMIVSTQEEFSPDKSKFFDYLDFKLYELLAGEDGVFTVGDPIPFQEAPEFFAQITDNTDYIIHPDELMADNFIYTISFLADGKKMKDFSMEGMTLITEIGKILKMSN